MKAIADFSPKEVAVFQHMHQSLKGYNEAVARDASNQLDKPFYEPALMAAYSEYMEILAWEEAEKNRIEL
jgi:hypothetical protein